MIATYASSRLKLPSSAFSINAIAGSTTVLVANTYNFSIQAENRAGLNLLSDSKSIAIVAGQGVEITINSDAIESGEDPFWIVVSLQTSGLNTDAVRVASFKVNDNTQVNRNALPATIQLTTDEHFQKTRLVADFASLPTTGMVDGAIAQTLDNSLWWRYDSATLTDADGFKSYGALAEGLGNWVRHYGTNIAYVADTQAIDANVTGADVELKALQNALEAPPKIGDADSTPIKYWLNNGFVLDGLSPIINGCYSFTVTINDQDYTSVFADKIKYKLLGYVDRDTGILDTSMDTVGDVLTWNPNAPVKLPQDLNRNHAAVYEVWLSYTQAEMAEFLPGGKVSFELNIVTENENNSIISEFANFQGDMVYPDNDRLLIVPGLFRLSGFATVKMPGRFGYLIDTDTQQPITIGLLQNTADQRAIIVGHLNGFTIIAQPSNVLNPSERIRAYISTESGLSNLTVFSPDITLSNESLTLTITQPINANGKGIIRSNYSDRFLAGTELGDFTPDKGRVILDIDGTIYESTDYPVTAVQTLDITISDLSNFTAITSLPTNDADFGLYEPSAIAVASNGAGSLSGSVRAYFGYYYDSNNIRATKIRHDIDDAIPTTTQSIGQILSLMDELSLHVDRKDNPHEVTHAQTGGEAITDAQQIAISQNTSNISDNANAIALNTASRQGLGSAATQDIGTGIGEIPLLVDVGGNPALPAVDGSQLTGIDALSDIVFVSGAFVSEATIPPKHYSIDTSTAVASTDLPSNAADTSRVSYSDRFKTFGTNNATLTPSAGDTIDGQPTFLLDENREAVTLAYDLTNNNWVVIDGIQSVATGAGDMLRSIYDPDSNNVVDKATAIDGVDTAGNLKLYGTDAAGTPNFYDIGDIVKLALEALLDPNKLLGSAIANFRDINNAPSDKFAPLYDLATNQVSWGYVNTGIGAGTILLYISQSIFETADGALSGYTPDRGTPTFTDIRILTTAAAPDNQIVSEQLTINVTNTGAVLDLGVSDTVISTDWIYSSGDNLAVICRYSSDGNMLLVDFSGTAIAVKTVNFDVIATVTTTGFVFNNGTSYRLEVRAIGVQIKVLVDNVEIIPEAITNDFKDSTSFGVGRLN